MIKSTAGKLHWNYFLALERDLELASRYVEFCQQNFNVYSIEFAHLLFAAASEVDVVAKLLCEHIAPEKPRGNIDNYRDAITEKLPALPTTQISVPRYGLDLVPWDNWTGCTNPHWWRSYNNVKHERDVYFEEATLKNALNALGGLLVLTYYYYSFILAPSGEERLAPKDTMQQLQPESGLLRLPDSHYYSKLLI